MGKLLRFPTGRGNVRLSVNIGRSTREVMAQVHQRYGWSATEAVHQAFGLLRFALEALDSGAEMAVLRKKGDETIVNRLDLRRTWENPDG